jgi:hypothetical protein
MALNFTLEDIRQVVRDLTSSPTQYQLTDAKIDDLINKFILFVLPDDMKPFKTLVPYVFFTVQNQVEYPFDLEQYMSLEPGMFCNGMQLFYYQDQTIWLREYQYQYQQDQFASGDGVATVFSVSANQVPIVPGTVIVTDGVVDMVDTNKDGILTATNGTGGAGVVDYSTGAITVTFSVAPPNGNNIILTWAPLINGRPRALYYNQGAGTIQFSPIPDQAYRIDAQAYIIPTAFIANGSGLQVPEQQYWGYTIGYGVAIEIFRRRGQLDQARGFQPDYDFYLDRAIGRSTQQYSSQRSVPKW